MSSDGRLPGAGSILDRKGKPIAINRSDFRVDIIPEQVERPTQTLSLLGRLLDLSTNDVDRIIKDLKEPRVTSQSRLRRTCPMTNMRR